MNTQRSYVSTKNSYPLSFLQFILKQGGILVAGLFLLFGVSACDITGEQAEGEEVTPI